VLDTSQTCASRTLESAVCGINRPASLVTGPTGSGYTPGRAGRACVSPLGNVLEDGKPLRALVVRMTPYHAPDARLVGIRRLVRATSAREPRATLLQAWVFREPGHRAHETFGRPCNFWTPMKARPLARLHVALAAPLVGLYLASPLSYPAQLGALAWASCAK
jgi:hypothetical protein